MNKLNLEKKYIKKVDVFIINQALHHCANPTKLLKNMSRYLKKDGLILINEPEISFFLKFFLYFLNDEGWSFKVDIFNVKKKLEALNIGKFIIFHPSAQYQYKIFPQYLRDELLSNLSELGISILITGSQNKIDLAIKKELPTLNNVFDFVGETTLEEYFALSKLSMAYVGMDTLNMHIAASQNKRIFVISGPTNLKMWSPWSNLEKTATSLNKPIQSYGRNTIFQSSLPCEVCGVFGCGHNHGINEFSYDIDPELVFNQVNNWFKNG